MLKKTLDELISQEQYKKLPQLEEVDLPAIEIAIKEGRSRIEIFTKEFDKFKKGITNVVNRIHGDWEIFGKKRIAAALADHLRQKGTTLERYETIKKDNNISELSKVR